MRDGLVTHIRQHCVANKLPNPGRYRMLFATAKGRRRLLLPGDLIHPSRDGKIWPEKSDLPQELLDLVDWAKARYGIDNLQQAPFRNLLDLRGSGRELWQGEPADEYVERLREERE
jgi:hypothetical protein